MRNALVVMFAFICLLMMASSAHAAKPKALQQEAPQQAQKERLVLMPLRIPEEDKNLQGAMETALVEGLQQKYIVFSGEQVAQKAREIFLKESRNTARKGDCDETRCMQGIAEAFQAELLATANVSKQSGSYFLALSVQNIFDNKVEYSKTLTCKNCDAVEVVDKLKELSGASVTAAPVAAATPEAPITPGGNASAAETSLWNGVRDTNRIDDYETYLAQYPNGKYAALAQNLIKKLQEAAESEAWQTANKAEGKADFQSYLNKYPQGRYAELAKARINKLKAEQQAKEEADLKLKAEQQVKEEADLWNRADSSSNKATVEAYLIRYPAGRYIAAANAKLKLIKEEELKLIKEEEAKILESIAGNMVSIPGKKYEMGKYEVTQKEWQAVMGNNPSKFSSCGDTCPVESVSWDDILIFLQKLNAKTGRQYRLPNEKEWEYACYGGAGGVFSSPDYCGGNDINAVAWYGGNSNQTTHPAGQKQANGYGLYDMSGNVWEWMENKYDDNSDWRALRGGSWGSGPRGVRAASRDNSVPAERYGVNGFRLARTLP